MNKYKKDILKECSDIQKSSIRLQAENKVLEIERENLIGLIAKLKIELDSLEKILQVRQQNYRKSRVELIHQEYSKNQERLKNCEKISLIMIDLMYMMDWMKKIDQIIMNDCFWKKCIKNIWLGQKKKRRKLNSEKSKKFSLYLQMDDKI